MRWFWWMVILQGAFALAVGVVGALTSRINLLFPIGPPSFPPSKKRAAIHFFEAMIAAALVMIAADALIALRPFAYSGYLAVMKFLGLELTELLAALLVVAIGRAAHAFKRDHQLWYGRIEVALAFAAAIITAKQIAEGKELFSALATMVGAVYFAARGFGNAAEGKSPSSASQPSAAPIAPAGVPAA